MPLNRTPPPHAPSSEANLSVEQNLSADYACEHEASVCSTPKLTFRNAKRRRSASDGGITHFMSEMRQLFQELKAQQSETINKLCSAVEDLRSSVSFLAEKYDSLASKYDKLESGRKDDQKCIKLLEEALEKSEHSYRSACLEIRNVPVNNAETKEHLVNTVINTGKALNLEIQPYEIKDVFRIKTKIPENKTIIVDLNSVILKEKIMFAVRKFNKGQNRLSTEHLKITGPAKPVFISENLTSKMKRVFFLARDYAKTNDFRFCWVSHGKIYLRKREGGALFRISSESDLTKLQKQK
ncbi:uncharacterized protein LOC120627002 [Pararge aegeria]|uniref:Jg6467 protein n=1 Tax=Pararge aegeria aegeria TaxID=348720 RepID=A0A8S4SR81_9NEOP|nr:uncharacterized protein LOC120627000 [Pararge aegeria]XP_039750773.1 uncharacterized protein LOC120627002 [Pararge aegeria]CAH2269991.1 jg6467 [Pararge aegeria aegeria]